LYIHSVTSDPAMALEMADLQPSMATVVPDAWMLE